MNTCHVICTQTGEKKEAFRIEGIVGDVESGLLDASEKRKPY